NRPTSRSCALQYGHRAIRAEPNTFPVSGSPRTRRARRFLRARRAACYAARVNVILDQVLQTARQLGASDVHIKVGLPPVFRIRGDLRTVRDMPPLNNEVVATFP